MSKKPTKPSITLYLLPKVPVEALPCRTFFGVYPPQNSESTSPIRVHTAGYWSARTYAEKSIAWCEDVAGPYQLLAQISQQSGDVAGAAAILEESLCLTALDSEHRIALIYVWRTLGRDDEARALAHQSECIFNAWLSATDVATRFRELLADMK